MVSDIAIRAEGLGKQYRIGVKQAGYSTLRDSLMEMVASPFRRLASVTRGQSTLSNFEMIWALKDVSFEVKIGEIIGVIGRNGAGKSTLLKILSRITEPTTGYADIYGRVGSLLEVGTGFHQELTGRENIYLSGSILGMKKSEIERTFDEIVAFAEIEKFLDTPVKRYSSGMYVRLAFAVAAHLQPEIMLVDEVLAVGDLRFQKKCLGKMGDVAKQGRTVFFVSHNLAAIQGLCTRGLLLENGQCVEAGDIRTVVNTYMQQLSDIGVRQLLEQSPRTGNGALYVADVSVSNNRAPGQPPSSGSEIRIDLELNVTGHEPLDNLDVGISLHDQYEGKLCLIYSSYIGKQFRLQPGTNHVSYVARSPLLAGGRYFLGVLVRRHSEEVDWPRVLLPFDVIDDDYYQSGNSEWRTWGAPVLMEGMWVVGPTVSSNMLLGARGWVDQSEPELVPERS